jgi:hypothetical protein
VTTGAERSRRSRLPTRSTQFPTTRTPVRLLRGVDSFA